MQIVPHIKHFFKANFRLNMTSIKILLNVTVMVLASLNVLQAQSVFSAKDKVTTIIYATSVNGKTNPEQNRTFVITNGDKTLVTKEKDMKGKTEFPFEFYCIDRKTNNQLLYAVLNPETVIHTIDSNAISGQKWDFQEGSKVILGYTCKKATTVINSNLYEVWYTKEAKIKAAPTILGQDLGLVLEVIRNGNSATTAIEINKGNASLPPSYSTAAVRAIDVLTYRDRIWKSRFTTIPVFSNQRINFSDTASTTEGVLRFAHGTIVLKKIHFPQLKAAKNIFVDLRERSSGDAYDRTGTVFMIPEDKKTSFLDGLKSGVQAMPVYENGNGKKYYGVVATPDFSPALELMRFFTPFGIGQYNYLKLKDKDWHNDVFYRQDITAFSQQLDGKDVYIGVFIGNYDKGGHIIDLNVTIHDDGEASRIPTKVIPLFNTLNIMEMAGQDYGTMFDSDNGLIVSFELTDTVRNASLRYITTGHGGWGNGDEFVPKVNTIEVDGKEVWKTIPWKEDCGSYRLYNPASGNFGDGLSSSDFSRSNWCPGTVTNPFLIPLGDILPGKHTLKVKIPQGTPEGSSFSSWNVSGVLIGN